MTFKVFFLTVLSLLSFNSFSDSQQSAEQATFLAQIILDDKTMTEGVFSEKTPIHVTGRIHVAASDINQEGEVLIVAVYDGERLMKTKQGWISWNGQLDSLKAAEPSRTLKAIETVDISTNLAIPGDFSIFLGYRANNHIQYSKTALNFRIYKGLIDEETAIPLQANAIASNTLPLPSKDRFLGQFYVDGQAVLHNTLAITQAVNIHARIYLAADKIGQTAEILRVVSYQGKLYMKTLGGWIPWNGQLSSLIASETPRTLKAIEDIEIEKNLSLAGEFKIFFGYRINNQLYYNETPLLLTLIENKAPIISGIPNTQLVAETAYSFTPTASDADNDTLVFSIINKPAWANFDSTTGQLSGIPSTGSSNNNIIISVSDGYKSVSLPEFSLIAASPGIIRNPENFSYDETATVGKAFSKKITTRIRNPVFSLFNAPEGMTINPVTGMIYWTPTPNQQQNLSVDIKISGISKVLNLTLRDGNINTENTVFLSPTGNNDGEGTFEQPLKDTKKICTDTETIAAGTTIYYRGGEYTNPGFGSGNLNNSSIPTIECRGEAGNPIVIKPWGNEKVKIKFDSFTGMRIDGEYLVFENFEIEGMNKAISLTEALDNWWIADKYYNGNGLAIAGHHLTIRGNIVHHIPGQAIAAKKADHFLIENNIVYNSAWWTITGTTGIGAVDNNSSDETSANVDSTVRNIEIKDNLIFGVESRIFSRVWRKGKAELTIDEGEGLLVQINEGTYQGRYLVKNNFLLFNGKGLVVNKTHKADVISNTLYKNGTTLSGSFKGLRGNSANDVRLENNAVTIFGNGQAYSMGGTSSNTQLLNNFFVGDDNLEPISGRTFVSSIFKNPENLNFSIKDNLPQNIGASQKTWRFLKSRADEYGIKIKPTNWIPDNIAITKSIIKNIPEGSVVDYSNWNDTDEFLINITNIPDENVRGDRPSEFVLNVRHPYKRNANEIPPTVDDALNAGDASLVTATELLLAAREQIAGFRIGNPVLATFYNNEPIAYDPSNRSQLITITGDYQSIFPILQGNGGKTLAVAGTKNNSRFAAFGAAPMEHFEDGTNLSYEPQFKRLLAWLFAGEPLDLSVLNSNKTLALSFTNSDTTDIKNWLGKNYANWTVVDCNDASTLANCYNSVDLIITGWQTDEANAQSIRQTLEGVVNQGTPVLYLHTWYEAKNDVAQTIAELFGFALPTGGNYWAKDAANWNNVEAMQAGIFATLDYEGIDRMLTHFQNKDYNFDWSVCDGGGWKNSCPEVVGHYDEFYTAANRVRYILTELDKKNLKLFSAEEYRLEKLLILIGDNFRQAAVFPMDKETTDDTTFLSSLFADYSVYNSRVLNPAQKDMGNFSRSDFSHITPHNKTINLTSKKEFRSTGVYALPGQTMRVIRNDNSAVGTKIFINTLRPEATHEFESNGYKRPKFLKMVRIEVNPGESIELTSPYGGPVQIAFDATNLNVSFTFENIGEHAYWANSADDVSFTQKLDAGDFDWAEVVTNGFEVHSKLDKMRESIANPTWGSAQALANATERYMSNFPHILAGFQGSGIDVVDEIHDFATDNALTIENLDIVKHMNADQASCGSGCSGNPYDAYWAYSPIDHGDLHEFGHGLEIDRFRFEGWVGHSTTNPYSYYTKSKYNEDTGSDPDCQNLPFQEVFEKLQASVGKADATSYLQSNLWANSGWSQQFMVTLQAMMHAQKMGRLDNGWHLLARLHILEREVKRAKGDWDAKKDSIGFSNYTVEEFDTMRKNDWMLISLSYAVSLDFRDYLDMMGIEYSQKAADQVAGFIYPDVPREFFVSTPNGYCKTDAYGSFLDKTTLNVDGSSIWPL